MRRWRQGRLIPIGDASCGCPGPQPPARGSLKGTVAGWCPRAPAELIVQCHNKCGTLRDGAEGPPHACAAAGQGVVRRQVNRGGSRGGAPASDPGGLLGPATAHRMCKCYAHAAQHKPALGGPAASARGAACSHGVPYGRWTPLPHPRRCGPLGRPCRGAQARCPLDLIPQCVCRVGCSWRGLGTHHAARRRRNG